MAWSDAARRAAAEMRKLRAKGKPWRLATERNQINRDMRAATSKFSGGNSRKEVSARLRSLKPILNRKAALERVLAGPESLPPGVEIEKHTYSGFRRVNGAQQIATKTGWRVKHNGSVIHSQLATRSEAVNHAMKIGKK
jgi:hypothetical protein